MPGNSPSAAFQEFIKPIRRTVSCITTEPVIISTGGRFEAIDHHSVSLADGEPILLSEKGDGTALEIGLLYAISENPDPQGKKFKVRTRGYNYTFKDFNEKQLCAYHWHPLSDDGYLEPHFHIHGTKPHYPMSRVSLELVVRAAITEFGAEPLRADWDQILALNHGVFTMWSTWRDASDLQKANDAYATAVAAAAKQARKAKPR